MSLSLAENVIVARADNRPPVLDKTQYSSWASRMLLYIKGKENAKELHGTNFDHLYAYLRQHEAYENEPPQASFPPIDSRLVVPSFIPSDDLIASLNKTIQGRHTLGYASSGARSNATGTGVNKYWGTNTTYNGDTVIIGQTSQEIPTLAAFQTDDLDAFDSDYDEAPSASAVIMAKLSSYD
nr:hypothetical protein [Tanacetum cinerariifolium]